MRRSFPWKLLLSLSPDRLQQSAGRPNDLHCGTLANHYFAKLVDFFVRRNENQYFGKSPNKTFCMRQSLIRFLSNQRYFFVSNLYAAEPSSFAVFFKSEIERKQRQASDQNISWFLKFFSSKYLPFFRLFCQVALLLKVTKTNLVVTKLAAGGHKHDSAVSLRSVLQI